MRRCRGRRLSQSETATGLIRRPRAATLLVTWITAREQVSDNFVDRVRAASNWHTASRVASRGGCWRRGSAARITAFRSTTVEPVFTGTDDLSSLFFQCGNEVLADLHRTLAGEPVSLMLTDAEGVVLSPAVRRPHPAPGTRRRPPRTRVRLLRTRGRHQRSRSGAGRPGAHAGARRPALRAEPLHLHLRRGAGARSRHRAGWRAASTSPPGRSRRAICCSRWPARRRATPRR